MSQESGLQIRGMQKQFISAWCRHTQRGKFERKMALIVHLGVVILVDHDDGSRRSSFFVLDVFVDDLTMDDRIFQNCQSILGADIHFYCHKNTVLPHFTRGGYRVRAMESSWI